MVIAFPATSCLDGGRVKSSTAPGTQPSDLSPTTAVTVLWVGGLSPFVLQPNEQPRVVKAAKAVGSTLAAVILGYVGLGIRLQVSVPERTPYRALAVGVAVYATVELIRLR